MNNKQEQTKTVVEHVSSQTKYNFIAIYHILDQMHVNSLLTFTNSIKRFKFHIEFVRLFRDGCEVAEQINLIPFQNAPISSFLNDS